MCSERKHGKHLLLKFMREPRLGLHILNKLALIRFSMYQKLVQQDDVALLSTYCLYERSLMCATELFTMPFPYATIVIQELVRPDAEPFVSHNIAFKTFMLPP